MKVSICGCGWLGLPLAKYLVAKGIEVYGSKTQPESASQLLQYGIHGIAITIPFVSGAEEKTLDNNKNKQKHQRAQQLSDFTEFFQTDVLVINVPPRRKTMTGHQYVEAILSLSDAAKQAGCQRVIFVSTTSVYGGLTGEVLETSIPQPDTESGRAHFYIEQQLRKSWGDNLVVLRLAGLIGPGRHPIKFLAGREGLSGGEEPVNLVYLDDCIQAIDSIIHQQPAIKVLHLAAKSHPTRKQYYTAMASKAGLPEPIFTAGSSTGGKMINADNSCRELDIILQHDDLMGLSPEIDGH
ncbi:SDR family oxidoreductase [Photobacterium lipolyticum]|uniref:Protein yeeZ n=1 Tax=Photobacterium lipolyticum TaxID=266810 RepID=A0A2T3N4H6_9GAMM|nr:SDR family oxidoreductase [Photobacterium lipolyticum]PSW07318.1 protein yeeZ precursor [Photobacterium lipolyticum]